MPVEYAKAYPRKSFFIDTFTRDLSLEDCILDLIDNSIDGLIRSRKVKPSEISGDIHSKKSKTRPTQGSLPEISVSYGQNGIRITDACGGIDLDYAREEAFNFGHGPEWEEGHLGAYGIGLKRALFKLGNKFRIESHTSKNGFICSLDVRKWIKNDERLEDWRFPIEPTQAAPAPESAGADIKITSLRDEVKMRLQDGTVDRNLFTEISRTYAFLLDRYVQIRLNGQLVPPFEIPLARGKNRRISFEKLQFEDRKVTVRIYASLGAPNEKGQWPADRAGWYVACNGRLVLTANQSDLSGWGVSTVPRYHPKFRQFLGLVFFESAEGHLLPWTTTKRGLNRESKIYLRVRNKMAVAAQPVLSYLSDTYGAEDDEGPEDREIAREVEQVSVGTATARGRTVFTPPARKKKTTTRVQYDVENEELEKARKHLRRSMPANRLGRHAFDYFMLKEGLA
jgi:hypothetical protein